MAQRSMALQASAGRPLHDAVKLGHLDVVQWLVTHGANVNAVDEDGKTASDIATEWAEDEVADFLKQRESTIPLWRQLLKRLTHE